jgi:HSF-type DNA-binding
MPPFPMILHRLLHDVESESETQRIISWDPGGKSFSVRQPQQFVEQIMGRYFSKQTHYKSFQVRTQLGMFRILQFLTR